MPFYSYVCTICKHITDVLVSIVDRKDEIPCEKCEGMAKHEISPSSFVINGYNATNNYSHSDKSRRK